jgi:hypothetical protein
MSKAIGAPVELPVGQVLRFVYHGNGVWGAFNLGLEELM